MNTSHSVLIIDDSPEIRILLVKFLRQIGFADVQEAENGRAGIEKVRLVKPDLIFLDGVMPEMDGLTALPKIKEIHPDSIVIITSSLTEKAKIVMFREAGADFYLLKPFRREKLEEVLSSAIALLEQRRRGSV